MLIFFGHIFWQRLYNISDDGPVALVEGEMDAARILTAGFPNVIATPGKSPGAKCWQYVQKLVSGREVILFPDPGADGRQWRDTACEHLLNDGATVRYVPATDKDIDDRLRSEKDPKSALKALIDGALEFGTDPDEKPEKLTVLSPLEIMGLEFSEDDNLLGDRLLAKGEMMSLLGPGGLGKSRVALQLAICCITGRDWLGIETRGQDTRWIFFQTENSARRLYYDLARMMSVLTTEGQTRINDQLRILTPQTQIDRMVNFSDPLNIARMESAVREHRADVVNFDPLIDFHDGDSENDAVEMRNCIHKMMNVAKAHTVEAATIIIHHSKTGRAGASGAVGWDKASYGRGSKALYSAVRAQVNLAPGEAEGSDLIVVSCGKSNNGKPFEKRAVRLDPETMTYAVDEDFDFEAWGDEIAGKSKGGRPPKMATEIVTVALRDLGGSCKKSELRDRIQQLTHCSRSKAYEVIKAAGDAKEILVAAGVVSLPMEART